MKYKVSVVVTNYNTEKYLYRCLDSIVKQTLEDIEIIIINDGSTDNSIDIIREFEDKDSRIKVFDIENQGVSHARNLGLSNASGDYVIFIDSDDYIEGNMLLDMFYEAINAKSDLVVCNLRRVFNNYKGDPFLKMPSQKILIINDKVNANANANANADTDTNANVNTNSDDIINDNTNNNDNSNINDKVNDNDNSNSNIKANDNSNININSDNNTTDNDITDTEGKIFKTVSEIIKNERLLGQSVFNKLYNINFLKKTNIVFEERDKIYAEDALFFFKTLKHIKTIAVVDKILYNYYHRSSSVSNTYKADLVNRCINFIEELKSYYNYDEILIETESLSVFGFTLLIEIFFNEINHYKGYKAFKEAAENSYFRKQTATLHIHDLSVNQRIIYILYRLRLFFIIYIIFYLHNWGTGLT